MRAVLCVTSSCLEEDPGTLRACLEDDPGIINEVQELSALNLVAEISTACLKA